MLGNKYKYAKLIIRIRACFIYNPVLRRRYRKLCLQLLLKNNSASKYKWGVSYSVFDGYELLESSIRSIRNHVDYVNVVYQKLSWYGVPADDGLLPCLYELQAQGLIDELIEYTANPNISAPVQEINKRNIGLSAAKRAGCNYFMTMDTDEFYIGSEFENAKQYIVRNEITHSFCNIVHYGLSPTDRLITATPSFVQFMSKIGRFSKLGKNKNNICLIDPTRGLTKYSMFGICGGGDSQYFLSDIQMHHFTYFRKDVIFKMKNSSSKQNHNCTYSDLSKKVVAKGPDLFNLMSLYNNWDNTGDKNAQI